MIKASDKGDQRDQKSLQEQVRTLLQNPTQVQVGVLPACFPLDKPSRFSPG